MSESLVLVAHDARISTVTINRPELNPLDEATLRALAEAIEEVRVQRPRCVIVTGAGDKAFSAGADIPGMKSMTKAQGLAFARLGQRAFDSLEALPCPVIAACNGFALGGGCELALACDFIFASDKAKLGQPEVKLGVLPGFGGTQRLARRIGLGRARELIYSGRVIGPEEALRIGLVNEVWPRRELMEKTLERAKLIAVNGPAAIRTAKRAINAGIDQPLAAGLELEAHAFGACFEEPEQREGMAAFLERRTPEFPDPTD